MGGTAELALPSKCCIMLLMFLGRLGPLALMDFFENLPPTDADIDRFVRK
jgi:Trk-type K+ transport system membrane component